MSEFPTKNRDTISAFHSMFYFASSKLPSAQIIHPRGAISRVNLELWTFWPIVGRHRSRAAALHFESSSETNCLDSFLIFCKFYANLSPKITPTAQVDPESAEGGEGNKGAMPPCLATEGAGGTREWKEEREKGKERGERKK